MSGLVELTDRIGALEGASRARAERLLDVRIESGRTDPPPELEPWLTSTFGSVESVRNQVIVKVTNLATLEATLFAPLRGRRPLDGRRDDGVLEREVGATDGDPFCHPATGTPAGPLGRVRGARMLTGANAALADAHHAVLVFDAHDPLAFDAGLVADLLSTGRTWADLVRRENPSAANYLLIWNCLWRAGGSIVHGHAQALLGAGPHYARVERFRRDAASYATIHGHPLIDDLVDLHRDLGLALRAGDDTWILAHLTPVKEREILVVGAPDMDEREPDFATAVARAVVGLRDRLGVRSFNLALWRPPLGDAGRSWGAMRPIARLVDRGDLASRPSDMGAMELYATPVVGSDPYEVVRALT